ncbi:unnamed protein product [Dicrocoelium dendriticum]|nr:unnamed protein product [Dicrocoelium dendriticum]
MQVWRKHFDCLLNNRSVIDWPTLNGRKQQDVKADLADTSTPDETQRALAQLRNDKCAGGDVIPPEVLKHGGPALLTALHHLVQRVWIEEEVPAELKDALVLPVYKGKGSKQCCTNYRGINLLSCVGKVLARILLNRPVSQIVEPKVAEEQCGFRSGRSTIDMVFAARQLQEKCREGHQPLYSLFVDFTNVFDTVNREALWLVLGKFGCPRKFVSFIECLHSGMRARVQLSGETSDDFAVVSGVKQGCVLAPALFNIYLHAMLSCAFDAACAYGVRVEHRIDGGLLNIRRFGARTLVCETTIRMLLFADDCALFSHSADELQNMTSALASTEDKFGLTINTSKTVRLFQPSPEVQSSILPQISIGAEVLETTSRFCYLGSVMSTDQQLHVELRIRVSKAAVAFGKLEYRVWNNHQLSIGTKLMVYKSMVLSVLLYGSETWTMYRRDVRYLERFHQQCLRRILRIGWGARVADTEVLRRSGMYAVDGILLLRHLRWLGHVSRMDSTRIAKQRLYGQVSIGKRQAGKAKLCYQDMIKVSLTRSNLDCRSQKSKALDRGAWRDLITKAVAEVREKALMHAEKKRKVRKRQAPMNCTPSTSSAWCCRTCGRECLSQAGLVSHERGHSGPLPKRRRVPQ